MSKYSINEQAELLVGKRQNINGIIIDFPCELGYHCPKCKYKQVTGGEYDIRLHWSEYNGFIWCEKCNKDYPSCLCMKDLDRATSIYLSCVRDAKNEENTSL